MTRDEAIRLLVESLLRLSDEGIEAVAAYAARRAAVESTSRRKEA